MALQSLPKAIASGLLDSQPDYLMHKPIAEHLAQHYGYVERVSSVSTGTH